LHLRVLPIVLLSILISGIGITWVRTRRFDPERVAGGFIRDVMNTLSTLRAPGLWDGLGGKAHQAQAYWLSGSRIWHLGQVTPLLTTIQASYESDVDCLVAMIGIWTIHHDLLKKGIISRSQLRELEAIMQAQFSHIHARLQPSSLGVMECVH
jgi:hypothetical protein